MPPIRAHSTLIIGGAQIFIASSNNDRVESTVQKIKASDPNTSLKGFTIDLEAAYVEERLEKLFADVVEANGGERLDHIVYIAARFDFRPVNAVTVEWLRSRAMNQFFIVVPLLIAKVGTRFLKESYKSSLIFTSGRITEKAVKGLAVAAAYSTGLAGLVKTLALEAAPIRVKLVSPGTTDTEVQGPDGSEKRLKSMAAAGASSILGKVGAPEEVAEAYLYLMKDWNATGSVVSTSGGVLLQ
ncbi:hypothetical protein VHEMI04567 [[Torrubiella] hemipterigena]|uniref:NAD(P)-binding protein n=1 Tax=[Torrubiella] hemipterigena TaxID=1531966 RepID=A0A0A1TET2_9HYPO|nr:hypothetical protein VHEMI04567 [[Torrubiella] hemipterigena]